MIWNPWATSFYALALLVVFAGVIDGQPLEKGQTTVRPYQFGFTIEEQQHRFEKRDERGIVMGEFGFITADGIYHVTVYATDEEGKFRILAMRNYPYESPPKTIEMIVKPNAKPVIITTTTTAKPIVEKKPLPKYNFNTKACSGCFLKNDIVKDAPEQDTNLGLRPVLQPPTITNTITGKPVQSSVNPLNKSVASSGSKTPTTNISPGALPVVDIRTSDKAIAPQKPLSNAQNPTVQQQAGAVSSGGKLAKGSSTSGGVQKSGTQNAGSGNSSPNSPSSKSSSTAAGDNGDLYHFKYLLDYNGHEETGARNGNKVGNFFSIGDDNVERTIEYIANEFGYQPRIRWRKLDAARTKPAENALKDYEFVWFRKD